MTPINLTNGSVVLETSVQLVITKYDIVAVVCWAIHTDRKLTSRSQVDSLVLNMIEAHGTQGVVRAANKYKKHSREATQLVDDLYPEMEGDKRTRLLQFSEN